MSLVLVIKATLTFIGRLRLRLTLRQKYSLDRQGSVFAAPALLFTSLPQHMAAD